MAHSIGMARVKAAAVDGGKCCFCQAKSLFADQFAKAVNLTFGAGPGMQNIAVGAYPPIAGFLHIKAGIETARLALFLQPRPNAPAVPREQVQFAAAEHLYAQYVVHRQTLANFFLLVGLGSRFPSDI